MILVEIVEEPPGPDWMTGDFQIVDVPFPVVPNLVDGRHGG